MGGEALTPLPTCNSMTSRLFNVSPAFREKICKMALPLSPLVQVDTGRIHPDFPRYLINYWLLSHDQLDSLATFYHQRFVGSLTFEYPLRVEWPDGMSLEQKRRRFGRFIGLRGCESPGRSPMQFNSNINQHDHDSVPKTSGLSTSTTTDSTNEFQNHSWFLEQLRSWRYDPGRNNMDWFWGHSDDPGNPHWLRADTGLSSRRWHRPSSLAPRSCSRARSRQRQTRSTADIRRTATSSQASRTLFPPRQERQQQPPIYRAEPDPDVEMTIPPVTPPDYIRSLADGQVSPLNPSRRRRRDPEDDELLFRKARWYY